MYQEQETNHSRYIQMQEDRKEKKKKNRQDRMMDRSLKVGQKNVKKQSKHPWQTLNENRQQKHQQQNAQVCSDHRKNRVKCVH